MEELRHDISSRYTQQPLPFYIPTKNEIKKEIEFIKNTFQEYTVEADGEMSHVPTNGHGIIRFTSWRVEEYSRYLRLANDSDMEELLKLMFEFWKLEPPQFVLSVIGTTKSLSGLNKNQRVAIHSGITEMAIGKNAWILTSGIDSGIAKIVGDAVCDYKEINDLNSYVLLGITPWSVISNRDFLVMSDSKGSFPADYEGEFGGGLYESLPLNPKHNYFLLVDDGRCDNYGGDIEFRIAFETKIASLPTTINVLTLCVGGDMFTIEMMKFSLQTNTPCVILEGSGGAADLVAYAYRAKEEVRAENFKKELHLKIRSLLNESRDSYQAGIEADIMSVLEYKAFIVIHKLEKNVCTGVENAILKGLLKTENDITNQILKALSLNLVGTARQMLTTHKYPINILNEVMLQSIKLFNIDFVKLMIDYGAKPTAITDAQIDELFWNYDIGSKKRNIVQIVDHHFNGKIYTPLHQCTVKKFIHVNFILFFRSLMHHNKESIQYFWLEGEDFINSAIFASTILTKLTKNIDDIELRSDLLQLADTYEEHAVAIVNYCWDRSQLNTLQLLTNDQGFFGINSVELAIYSQCEKVLATEAFQDIFIKLWFGSLSSKNSTLTVITAFFIPIMIPFLKHNNIGKKHGAVRNIFRFYSSPINKYIQSFVVHLILVMLFTLFLVHFYCFKQLVLIEYIVLGFVVALILEEFKLLISEEGSVFYKIKSFFSDFWHTLVLFGVIFYIIGTSLRFFYIFQSNYCSQSWSQMFLAFSLIFFALRILHFYYISSRLGPKVVTITKMFSDMIVFIVLLVFFMILFGFSGYVLRYISPQTVGTKVKPLKILNEAIFYPYFRVYGSLFSDDYGFDKNERNNIYMAYLMVYMIISNGILLSMVIAMFGYTYSKVEERTELVWKAKKFQLLRNFQEMVPLAGPLVVLYYIYAIAKLMCRCFQRVIYDEVVHGFPPHLKKFEAKGLYLYFEKKQDKFEKSAEFEFSSIFQTILTLEKLAKHNLNTISKLNTRINDLTALLLWIDYKTEKSEDT